MSTTTGAPLERFMLDPSVLLQERALDLFEKDLVTHPESFVVSSSFASLLDTAKPESLFSHFAPGVAGVVPSSKVTARLSNVIRRSGIGLFSHEGVELSNYNAPVLSNILDSKDEPARYVYADEFAYLQSHSGLLSAIRHPIEIVRGAGAAILEYGQRALNEVLRVVMTEQQIARHSVERAIAIGAVKWLVLGAGIFVAGAFGWAIGTFLGGPLGAGAGALTTGLLAGKALPAMLLAAGA